ncbi:MAG: hypothetical protein IJ523_03410 [Succinivibrionaceae bacterium]|nr:hypothetical protein [Succinivibrionaceae bacterium]
MPFPKSIPRRAGKLERLNTLRGKGLLLISKLENQYAYRRVTGDERNADRLMPVGAILQQIDKLKRHKPLRGSRLPNISELEN